VLAGLKLAVAKPVTYPTPTQLRRLQLGLAFGNPKFLVIANLCVTKLLPDFSLKGL
jgi:D-ribose pyranose/furanose isomerase RbsD